MATPRKFGIIGAMILAAFAVFAQTVDRSFMAASAFTVASTLSDSYTTTWIRPNWLATPLGQIRPCAAEGSSPWLYGIHPSPARAWGVGITKIALAESLALVLKSSRHRRLRAIWALPLLLTGMDSSLGALHNYATCPQGVAR